MIVQNNVVSVDIVCAEFLPFYATPGSAGLDLCSVSKEDIIIPISKRRAVPTGVHIALSDGIEAQIRSRSGLTLKNGVIVLNAPGTVDSDYRGEIIVILANLGEEDFCIKYGMKIAQLVIASYVNVNWNVVKSLESTSRGIGGFGSTGEYAK